MQYCSKCLNLDTRPDLKFYENKCPACVYWESMVDETRLLEQALGDGKKKIEKNELKSSIVQKRSFYATQNIMKGNKIKKSMIIPLRPNLKNSFNPSEIKLLLNKKSKLNIKKNECIKKNHIH